MNDDEEGFIEIDIDVPSSFTCGELFNSYDELVERLDLYSEESFVHFWRRDSRTVEGAHMKIARPVAERLKYYSIKFACIFGGQKYSSRGVGQRRTPTLRTNCPAHILLRATKSGEHLEVLSVSNTHNHAVSEELYRKLPQHKKLPPLLKKEIQQLLRTDMSQSTIKEYVRLKADKALTSKDLFNIAASRRSPDAALPSDKLQVLVHKVVEYIDGAKYEQTEISNTVLHEEDPNNIVYSDGNYCYVELSDGRIVLEESTENNDYAINKCALEDFNTEVDTENDYSQYIEIAVSEENLPENIPTSDENLPAVEDRVEVEHARFQTFISQSSSKNVPNIVQCDESVIFEGNHLEIIESDGYSTYLDNTEPVEFEDAYFEEDLTMEQLCCKDVIVHYENDVEHNNYETTQTNSAQIESDSSNRIFENFKNENPVRKNYCKNITRNIKSLNFTHCGTPYRDTLNQVKNLKKHKNKLIEMK